jgi:hypothetical protein
MNEVKMVEVSRSGGSCDFAGDSEIPSLSLSLSYSLSKVLFFLSLQRAATTGGLSSPAKTHQTK